MAQRELNIPDICAGFQQSVIDVLVGKTMRAVSEYGANKVAVAGGVAANSALRKALEDRCEEKHIKLYLPEPVLCTDNGAMIGSAAYYKYKAQGPDNLLLDAYANLPF